MAFEDVGPGGLTSGAAVTIETNQYSFSDNYDYNANPEGLWYSLTSTNTGVYSFDQWENTKLDGTKTDELYGLFSGITFSGTAGAKTLSIESQGASFRQRVAVYLPAGSSVKFSAIGALVEGGVTILPALMTVRIAGPTSYTAATDGQTFQTSTNTPQTLTDLNPGTNVGSIIVPTAAAIGDVALTIIGGEITSSDVDQSTMTNFGRTSGTSPTNGHFFWGRITNKNPIPFNITATELGTAVTYFYRTNGQIVGGSAYDGGFPVIIRDGFAWVYIGAGVTPLNAGIVGVYVEPLGTPAVFGSDTKGFWTRSATAVGVDPWIDAFHWTGGPTAFAPASVPEGNFVANPVTNSDFRMRAVFLGIIFGTSTVETWDWPFLWSIPTETPVVPVSGKRPVRLYPRLDSRAFQGYR